MGITVIQERDESGRIYQLHLDERTGTVQTVASDPSVKGTHDARRIYILDLLTRVFLPAGYPNSVSPDYIRYQILNALQAFCNSLAGLLSSRAVLQDFGVGDPTATPTKAMLLTVLKDVFARLTTILSAHIIGSSLYPEAKTYRLLADVLNDIAVILETLSPLLNTVPIPGLRISLLCLSAVFRSLCGISAGGSKAAITMHFASPLTGKGDVGDLNAKDSSKETVLALFGMLLGTLIIPYLSTPWTTYTSLFILVGLHLWINYLGVRGIVLRTLNRQRLGIAWLMHQQVSTSKVPTPPNVANLEAIFDHSGIIRDLETGQPIGQCIIGSSFSKVLHQRQCPPGILDLFSRERYIIWFDHRCLRQDRAAEKCGALYGFIRLHIFLKEGYTTNDQMRAWVHAVEICHISSAAIKGSKLKENRVELDALDALQTAYDTMDSKLPNFVKEMQSVGWNTDECAIMAGLPNAVVTGITVEDRAVEEKKTR